MRARVVVVDSVTSLDAGHADTVVVSGSHGGVIAARYVASVAVRGAVFNDAGVGCDDAGVSGLDALAIVGIPSAAVSHCSARIGDGADTLASGIISRANVRASAQGVTPGMSCREAVALMCDAPSAPVHPRPFAPAEGRFVVREAVAGVAAIVALDSIGLVERHDAQCILVVGSHGGLHGGDVRSALGVEACAAFFHDAGRGRDDAGTTRLPALAQRGIAAGVVDFRSARIGDARSMWATGVLSCVNPPLAALGVVAGNSLQGAVARIDAR